MKSSQTFLPIAPGYRHLTEEVLVNSGERLDTHEKPEQSSVWPDSSENMNNPINHGGRLERNLTWQTRNDPYCRAHLSKVVAIIEDGGILRRCLRCGCALLRQRLVNIPGEEIFKRCPSCGNLEAE